MEEQDLEKIEKKIEEEGQGWVHYFAGNLQVSIPLNIAPFFRTHTGTGRM